MNMAIQSATDTPGKGATVAIVLPCLNEARTIQWCVARSLKALHEIENSFGIQGEVIVADNGSTDGSQSIAADKGARVISVRRPGYGSALLGGIQATEATYIVMGDADKSYDFIESVPMVGRLIQGIDLCMGSRFKGRIMPGAMPWKNQYIGNPVLSGILRVLFRTSLSDAHCGLRAFRRDAINQLELSSTGMEFASEMVLKSVLQGLSVDEVPVTLHPDGRGRPPHLNPWRDGLRHLVYMLLLSPKHLFLWPALFMFSIGLALMTMLLVAGDQNNVQFFGFRFGDHWTIVASAALIVSVQTASAGILALQYSYQKGYRRPPKNMTWLRRLSRLENWIFVGTLFVAIGIVWAVSITLGWIASEFSALDQMRNMIASGTLVVIGMQVFFSGLLMTILAGNRASHFFSLDG